MSEQEQGIGPQGTPTSPPLARVEPTAREIIKWAAGIAAVLIAAFTIWGASTLSDVAANQKLILDKMASLSEVKERVEKHDTRIAALEFSEFGFIRAAPEPSPFGNNGPAPGHKPKRRYPVEQPYDRPRPQYPARQ